MYFNFSARQTSPLLLTLFFTPGLPIISKFLFKMMNGRESNLNINYFECSLSENIIDKVSYVFAYGLNTYNYSNG